jgi:hypothetical protein
MEGCAILGNDTLLLLVIKRQRDKHTENIRTDIKTNKQTDKQTNRQTDKQTDKQTNRQTAITNKHSDRVNKQTDKWL